MYRRKAISTLFLLIIFCFLAIPTAHAAEDRQINLGTVNWPGVTIKTEVTKQILEALGYQVDVLELDIAPIMLGLANDDLDAFLGCWWPNQSTYMEKYLDTEEITKLSRNLDQTIYCHAVPEYVWEAGVHSMADLDKPEFRDKFDLNKDGKPELYGIEAGNVGNKITDEAIANDTYGLGDWELVQSSEAGMLSQVKKAVRNEQWIVFQGWEPHWMTIEWDLKFLEDPEEIWPGQGRKTEVWTVIRTGLKEDDPNVVKFLDQIKVTPDWQSKWIYDFSYAKKDQDDIAEEWIQSHLEDIAAWVDGVQSLSGEPAEDVLRAKFE
ncbi:MAG: ABC transporter substrate-binding protein [Desulfovermiculus sp.]